MTASADKPNAPAADPAAIQASGYIPTAAAPFFRAPEGARHIYMVTLAAACGPLVAGIVLFGWRAAIVAIISIASCVIIESLLYRVARVPALLGRSHAYLTGVLLALTLPAFVPWYVPVVAAAFAIILGKAIFGGEGHFLWQPALVGRLAVAAIFAATLNPAGPPSDSDDPLAGGARWPVLAQEKLVVGDLSVCRGVDEYSQWRNRAAPPGADGFLLPQPRVVLSGLNNQGDPAFSALAYVPRDVPHAKPALIPSMPAINDFIYGARPGGLGETCAVVIIVAGLYLIYRNYVKWQLPLMFLGSAAAALAIAPVYFAGAGGSTITVWWPVFAEGGDVGFVYLCYQLLSGEMLLAAFFLATEMTSRPVTTGGQVVFGAGCGVLAVALKFYTEMPIPAYMAVLAMNTLTPAIDALWRPRVLGTRRFWQVFSRARP